MSDGVGSRPPPGGRYLRSCAHFWMSAVLLGSAFSMHFEYFWKSAALGDEPEPPDPPEPPDEPDPPLLPEDPEPPPSPPSAPCSSEIGFGFGGAVTVCGSPALEEAGGKGKVAPPAAR